MVSAEYLRFTVNLRILICILKMPKKRKSCSNLSANPWRKIKLLRKLETPEKRAIRLEKQRQRNANRRARETILEREERLARVREAARKRRANAKMEVKRAQQKIAIFEEKSKVAAQHTITMFRDMNFVNHKPSCAKNMQRRRATEVTNNRRCRKEIADSAVGHFVAQNHPLNTLSNEHHLAYNTFIEHTFIQSQFHQKAMRVFSKTPDQILQLGLIAYPPETWSSDSYENENDCSVGVECEVTTEECEELEDKKLFSEENSLNDIGKFETVICGPSLVNLDCSNEQESMIGDEQELIIGF